MSWIVTQLSTQKIKGIPDQAGDFDPAQEESPSSIAIYAPDACDTSGYADAVEHLLPEDGSILRQHDLKHFVADMTFGEPWGQGAVELPRWLGLTHLEQVLQHLEATSSTLAERDLNWEIVGRVQDIARHTDNSVTEYDERAVLDWCEAEIQWRE
jgi:hypothetical protein